MVVLNRILVFLTAMISIAPAESDAQCIGHDCWAASSMLQRKKQVGKNEMMVKEEVDQQQTRSNNIPYRDHEHIPPQADRAGLQRQSHGVTSKTGFHGEGQRQDMEESPTIDEENRTTYVALNSLKSTAPFTKDQVVNCFTEETKRLERQAVTESVFGVLGGAADIGSGVRKYNKKRGLLIQMEGESNRFIGAIIGGVAAIGGAVVSGAHAVENAAADNCMEKGFESVLAGIENVQAVAERTETMVQNLATSSAENHKAVMAGQNEMQRAFRDGVAQLEGNQRKMMQEAKSFRAAVEDSIGRLDEEMSKAVRNQMTLSLQLDQLSLQLFGTEQRLLAEAYSSKAANVISNAKVITGALEDVQDIMGQIHDHRSGWPTLDLDSGNDPLANVMRWGNTEKLQQQELRRVVSQSWTRARDAFSAIAVALSEGDFLRKYFLQGLRIAAEEHVSTEAASNSGQCGTVIRNMQPLLNHLSSSVLHENEMIQVLVDTIIQVHDIFKTMVLIFGRHSVSPAQYKDSLVTLSHAFTELRQEFSDPAALLKLVQPLVAPVLSTQCPLSPGCRDGAFTADHIAASSKGVQINSNTIAFEPLSHISHSSADAAFYACSALPSPIPAEVDNGAVTKAQVLTPANCKERYYSGGLPQAYQSCSSTQKSHSIKCPSGYVMRTMGKVPGPVDITFKCTKSSGSHCRFDGCQWYTIQWQSKRGNTNWENAGDATFQCELRTGQSSHVVSATRKTAAQADTLVDNNFASWTLGGTTWNNAADVLASTLASATEDAVSRLFMISNHQKCAESLPHGNLVTLVNNVATANWDRQSPYFCWDCVVERHDQWLTRVVVSTRPELSFTLIWKFDKRQTLHERLKEAIDSGVAVTWEADWGNKQHKTISGTWRFSRAARSNDLTKHDGGLSGDDGAWAAGQYVDGEASHGRGMQFGHQNKNAGDAGECHKLWVDGTEYANQQFTSKMYVVY